MDIVHPGLFLGVSCQVSLLYVQGCSWRCHVKCRNCLCSGDPGVVLLSVTVVCAGVFLGVSCQVSLLYVHGCSLGCHVKCHYWMCWGVPGGVTLTVIIVFAGQFLVMSSQVSSVTIQCSGGFLGVSCQLSLLYWQGCSLGCHVKCHFWQLAMGRLSKSQFFCTIKIIRF